jgi:CheY-like chemotaxis protein
MLNNTMSHSDESAGAASPAATDPRVPIRIWLVDDNRHIRSAMMEMLNACAGLQCKAAFPSPNAVLSALASKTGPDVILLDIQMGEACGLDAIRPIKALSRSTQILMFTTCFDHESRRRALSAGASGFLLKHYSLEQILDSIQHASQNPAPHLKRLPKPAPAGRSSGTVPLRPGPVNQTAYGPQGRWHWLWQWLNFMHLRRN